MADPGISTDRQGVLLRALFKVLIDHPDGLQGREAILKMWELEPPTEYEAGHYPSQPKEIRGTIATRFYTVNCVKAGWMEKSAAVWKVTDLGRQAFEDFTDPGVFARESSKQYIKWKKAKLDAIDGGESEVTEEEDGTASVVAATTLETAREDAWSEIVHYIETIDPYDFQDLIAALLRALGYHIAHVSPPGPDRGLDILAYTDPLGANGPRIKVQVKRRAEKTSVDGIRAFMAILGPGDIGVYISSGGFTSDAEKEARHQEVRRITLLDLEQLVSLWVANIEKIRDIDRPLLPLKPVWFLAPES